MEYRQIPYARHKSSRILFWINPSLKLAMAIAKVFDATVEELISFSEDS